MSSYAPDTSCFTYVCFPLTTPYHALFSIFTYKSLLLPFSSFTGIDVVRDYVPSIPDRRTELRVIYGRRRTIADVKDLLTRGPLFVRHIALFLITLAQH